MSQFIPHDFILEFLHPLPIRRKKMFGVTAIYYGEKIILATKSNPEKPVDNGLWVGTKLEHHQKLFALFPSLTTLESYKIKTWLLLPETIDDFEETARDICELIKQESPLIGNIPKPKKSKK